MTEQLLGIAAAVLSSIAVAVICILIWSFFKRWTPIITYAKKKKPAEPEKIRGWLLVFVVFELGTRILGGISGIMNFSNLPNQIYSGISVVFLTVLCCFLYRKLCVFIPAYYFYSVCSLIASLIMTILHIYKLDLKLLIFGAFYFTMWPLYLFFSKRVKRTLINGRTSQDRKM